MSESKLQKKIVVIEDEPDILDIITYNLKREGFSVHSASSGEEGLVLVSKEQPDLVLLDLMLPGIDGLEVCQKIKANEELSTTAVILVTAKGEESDVVLGLGIGADDYIPKPFSPREMIARVKAVIRRYKPTEIKQESTGTIDVGDLKIDQEKHRVTYKDTEMSFTVTEFRILYFLASKRGRVFTREQIINSTISDKVIIVDRNMDVHIRAIRKKLGEGSELIETIRGIGYRFKE